jgi:hypothetical protein
MRKLVLALFLIVSIVAAKAQVKGTVIDSAGKKPIDKAVIGLVIKTAPADTAYTFTNEKGEFSFDIVPASNFSVVISNSGFGTVAKFVPVNKQEKTIDIGNVILVSRAKLLDEVVIESAPIVVKEDTVEYRADAFKTKEGAVVEDLLKKLPGLEVDKDGNIKAQGKSVTRIKVNGKDFFGGDVKTATKELPANIVDKIQVIDDYGDQATVSGIKDGDPDKIINIQLKKDKNKGFFGRATVGGGTEDRYQASFNGNYFNNNRQISVVANSNNTNASLFNFGGGGNRGMSSMMSTGMSVMNDMGGAGNVRNMVQSGDMSIFGGGNTGGITSTNSFGTNFRDQWGKKLSVYGSYSYSHRNTSQLQNTSSQNFFTGTSFINNQDQQSISIGSSHRATFNLEYQIDSFNYLKVTPNINYSNNDGNSYSLFDYTENGGKTRDGSNKAVTGSTSPNLSLNVLYNHKFRKRGRNFSASGSFGNSESNSDQNITNLSYQYTGNYVGPRNTFQYIDQENSNHNYGVRFTYSEPISKVRTLDFSASHNLNYSRNDKKNYNVDSLTQVKTMNSILSNDYENNFYNNRAGISLRTTMKKYNYTVGISVQPVDLQGKSLTKDSAYKSITRVNVFPVARMTYNFSRTKAINMSYSGTANQPSFSQLQPVVDPGNQQNITAGNPNLKPSINHNINVSFNNFNFITGKVLFTNFTLSTIKNQIINKTARLDGGGSISVPENANGYYNLMGLYTYSKPYKNRKYVLTFNGSANYNHNINLTDSMIYSGGTLKQNLDKRKVIGSNWIVSQGFVFELNLKDWLQMGSGINFSLNDNKYKNAASTSSSSAFKNTSSNAWSLTNNINIDLTKRLILKYDLDYTINNGLASGVSQNPVLMNASLEQQLFKKKNGIIKFAAFDLFKQNTNINRSVNGNAIVDTRTNRLTRYFLLTFTYRIQKFAGVQPQGGGMRTMGAPVRMF